MTRRTSRLLLWIIRGLMLGCLVFAVIGILRPEWYSRLGAYWGFWGFGVAAVLFCATVLWWRAQRNVSDGESNDSK